MLYPWVPNATQPTPFPPTHSLTVCQCRAVAEKYRRRGLGRLLLEACERAAVQLSPPVTLMGLVVYRYNDPGACLQGAGCQGCWLHA